MRAVGAFRQQPIRRYEYQGRASETIDAAGRSVVDALIEDSRRGKKRGELFSSVNRWLKTVGACAFSRSAHIQDGAHF